MNKEDILPIKQIVTKLYSSGRFTVKHTVSMRRRIKSGQKVSIFNTWHPLGETSNSLYVDSSSIGALTFETLNPQGVKVHSYISQRYYHQLKNTLNVGIMWLTSKEYSTLYTHNSNDMVTGINDIPIHIPIISLSSGNSFSIIPSVITDYNDVKYEGIAIRGTTNTIGLLTSQEFLNMALQINGYIDNVHGVNMSMINTIMLYTIGQNIGLRI